MGKEIHTMNVLGVVGAGLMGRGIAQIAAQAGLTVFIYDAQEGAASKGCQTIGEILKTLADKGKITAEQAAESTQRLKPVAAVSDLAPCDIVIEAIIENLDIKQELFKQLDQLCKPTCILATNTSSLSVTAIASVCQQPNRVAGYHFFSPVPLMKIVEVIQASLTEPWVADALCQLATRMGHTPVRTKDTPGFIVNHAGRGFGTEALKILGENVADFWQIDTILRGAGAYRMGPFELLDLTGLDVSQPVMESIYHQYFQEPRFRPSPLAKQRLMAGLLGRKTGKGFYAYASKAKVAIEPTPIPKGDADRPIWLSQRNRFHIEQVKALLLQLKATLDTGEQPSEGSLCVVLPLGEDVATACVAEQLDAKRCIALDPIALTGHRTLMTSILTSEQTVQDAVQLFSSDDTPVTVINDSNGFVMQRVQAVIVNIACDMAQQGIATPSDIDTAVKLGLAYPLGPFALGDQIGPAIVCRMLDNIFHATHDPRYRVSPWLRRRAALGLSLATV